MNKRGLIILISAALFVPAEIALGYLLQITEGTEASIYRFASIVLSCAFCLLLMRRHRDYCLVQLALVFTVFADWFLVMEEPRMQLEGMICFSVVQLSYAVMLFSHHRMVKAAISHALIRIFACVAAIIAATVVLGDGADAVSLISMFYYANIVMNLIISFGQLRRSVIFPIGILLFIICDTFIGLNLLLQDYLSSSEAGLVRFIGELDFDIAWAFYLPSQLLIPLSLIESEIREKRRARRRKTV